MPSLLHSFLKDHSVASVAPTSRFGVRKICQLIDFERAKVIVEYGPGTGVISKPMLERMRPDAKLILMETNPELVQMLKDTIRDLRAIVVEGSAENVTAILAKHRTGQADCVISGIPFSQFSEDLAHRIIAETHRPLRAGGMMIAYQFRGDVRKPMLAAFGAVRSYFVLLNIPPLRMFVGRKP